jgi:hypothetical protein
LDRGVAGLETHCPNGKPPDFGSHDLTDLIHGCVLHLLLFPNMLVIVLMNAWYLGVNIGMGTTYATLLEAPPYNWAPKWAGMAQLGQIVVAFVALPALGILSDKLITYMARRNGGVHEREQI